MNRSGLVLLTLASLLLSTTPGALAEELMCAAGERLVTETYTYEDESGQLQSYESSYCVPETPEWEQLGIVYESPCPRVDTQVWAMFRDRVVAIKAQFDDIATRRNAELEKALTDEERDTINLRYDQEQARMLSTVNGLQRDVDEAYEALCPPPEEGEQAKEDYSADCYEQLAKLEAATTRLSEQQYAEWAQLDAATTAEVDAFAQGKHSEAEWDALYASIDARFRDLEKQHAAEWDGFYAAHALEECAPTQGDTTSTDGSGCDATFGDEQRRLIDDALRRAVDDYESSYWGPQIEAFTAAQAEALAAFKAEGHTDDEVSAFETEQHVAYAALRDAAREDIVAYLDQLRADWAAFAQGAADGCIDVLGTLGAYDGEHLDDFKAAYFDEQDQLAFAFQLQQDAALTAFLEKTQAEYDACAATKPAAECQAARDAALEGFYAQLEADATAFYAKMQQAWDEAIGESLEDGSFEETLGEVIYDPETGDADGTYSSFQANDNGVSDVSVSGLLLFDHVYTTGASTLEFDPEQAYAISILGERTTLYVHDDDSGQLWCWAGGDERCVWDVADHLDLARAGDHYVITSGGVVVGFLAGEDVAIEDGNRVHLAGESWFILPLADSDGGFGDEDKELLEEAILDGDVGADINLADAEEGASSSAVRYGEYNISLETERNETTDGDDVTVFVDSEKPDGTVVTFTLDFALLSENDLESLSEGAPLAIDWCDASRAAAGDCEPQVVCLVDSLEALLAHDHGGGCTIVAFYSVDKEANLVHVAVKIEHFSVKGIRFRALAATATAGAPLKAPPTPQQQVTTPTSATPSTPVASGTPVGSPPTAGPAKGTPGPSLALALVALAAVALFGRRR